MPEIARKYMASRFSPLMVEEVKPKPVLTFTEQYLNDTYEFVDKIWRILGHITKNILGS